MNGVGNVGEGTQLSALKTLNDDRLRHFCGDRDQVNPKDAIEIDFAVTTGEYMVGVASNTFPSNIK